MKKPKTDAERSSKYRKTGRPVSFVITDKKAIDSLAVLADEKGGVKPAIEHALIVAGGSRK